MPKITATTEALQAEKYQVYDLGDITSSDILHLKVERDRKLRVAKMWIPGYNEKFLKSVHPDN